MFLKHQVSILEVCWNRKVNWSCSNISQCCFLLYFDQINAALLSRRETSFKNIKTTFEWLCTWHNIWRIKYMANYCCCPSTKIE